MAIRTIRKNEDPILRKNCRQVENIDDKVLSLLDDMAETMYATDNGAGLAAPQVGILKRVVVYDMGQGLVELINPEIIEADGLQVVTEGCLSLPGKWGRLERPKWVRVKALNRTGQIFEIEASGETAKCLCHEIDHLDGKLFTDKVIEYL